MPPAVAAVAAAHGAEVLRRERVRRSGGVPELRAGRGDLRSSRSSTPTWWSRPGGWRRWSPTSAPTGWRWSRRGSAPRPPTPSGPATTPSGRRSTSVASPVRWSPGPGSPTCRPPRSCAGPTPLRTLAPAGFDPTMPVGEDVDLVLAPRRRRVAVLVRGRRGRGGARRLRRAIGGGRGCGRRFDYGSSAAPLDHRHPGSVAPLGVSGWSLGAWALVALGHPVVAVGVVAGTAGALVRKLDFLDDPRVGGGARRPGPPRGRGADRPRPRPPVVPPHPRRGARLVDAPAGSRCSPPSCRPCSSGVAGSPDIDPARWVVLSVVDDVAYAVGVWRGCVSERSFGAVRPNISDWPDRSA